MDTKNKKSITEPMLDHDSPMQHQEQDGPVNHQGGEASELDAKRELQARLSVLGGAILHLYLGCFFLWGNINPYVQSYFYQFQPDVSYDFIFMVDTILVLANWIGYNCGAYLLQNMRCNPKLIIALGGTISMTGFFFSSMQVTLQSYILCYALGGGIGCGICYHVPLVCGWEFFPRRRGLITGIIISAYGFGAFMWALLSTRLVNPDKLDPDIQVTGQQFFGPEVANRVPYMIRTLVLIWSFLIVTSIFLIKRKQSGQQWSVQNNERNVDSRINETEQSENDIIQNQGPYENLTRENSELKGILYCLKSIRFWQLFAMMVCGNFFGTFFSYSYKAYGSDNVDHEQISDQTLTWAASIGSGLVNGLTRLSFGAIQDQSSFRTLFALLMTIQLFNSLIVYWAANYAAVYFCCVMMNYMCLGGMFAVFPASVTNIFGLNQGPQVYVLVLFGSFTATFLNVINTKYLMPALNNDFQALFRIGSVVQAITLILVWFYKEELDFDGLKRRGALKLKALQVEMSSQPKIEESQTEKE